MKVRNIRTTKKAVSAVVGAILLIAIAVAALASVQLYLSQSTSKGIRDAEAEFDITISEWERKYTPNGDVEEDDPWDDYVEPDDGDDSSGGSTPTPDIDPSAPTLSFGDPIFFNSVYYMSIAVVDEDRIVIAYSDGYDGGSGKVKVGNVGETTVSFGEPTTFFSEGTINHYDISVISLGNDKILVLYRNTTCSHGTARVGIISGDTISMGEPSVFNEASTKSISAVAIDNDNVMILFNHYHDSDGYSEAIVGTISGEDSILFDTESVEFDNTPSTRIRGFSAKVLYDDHIIVSYLVHENGCNKGKVMLFDVSGDTISFSEEKYVFSTELKQCVPQLTVLDSEHVLVAYTNNTGYYGKIKVLTRNIENNNIMIPVDAISIGLENTTDITSAIIDGDHVVISYKTNTYGIASLASLSGNYELCLNDPIVLENNCHPNLNIQPLWIFTNSLDSERVITLYRDKENPNSPLTGKGNAYVVIGTYA